MALLFNEIDFCALHLSCIYLVRICISHVWTLFLCLLYIFILSDLPHLEPVYLTVQKVPDIYWMKFTYRYFNYYILAWHWHFDLGVWPLLVTLSVRATDARETGRTTTRATTERRARTRTAARSTAPPPPPPPTRRKGSTATAATASSLATAGWGTHARAYTHVLIWVYYYVSTCRKVRNRIL